MAPPTGPAATTTRTTRSSTGAARGGPTGRGGGPTRGGGPARGGGATRGGGIRKRGGGGPARIDRDGDLTMGQVSTTNGDTRKNTTSSRGRSASTRGSRSKANTSTDHKLRQFLGAVDPQLASRISEQPRKFREFHHKKVLKITGLAESKAASNDDHGEKATVEFLERKATKMIGRTVKISRSRFSSDHSMLYILVNSEDAEEIAKLDKFVFAGAALHIAEHPEGWPQQDKSNDHTLSKESIDRKNQLKEVLGRRYNPDAKLLDLSDLGHDPILAEMGFLENQDRAEKTFKILMKICEETFPSTQARRDAAVSVSLANNQIETVFSVFTLAITFPDLKNLDLSGNRFASLSSLNRWRWRFRHLENLLIHDNPLAADPSSNYQKELLDWFPKLQFLNNTQVRTAEELAAAAAAQPTPMPQLGADFRDDSGFAEAFLTQFIALYDSDRAQLASIFYDAKSRFSLSVTTNTPRDHSDSPVLPWAAYLRTSRNLTRITTLSARVQRLFEGVGLIKDLWKTLPATKHPDLKTETHKYLVDCHPIPGLVDPSGQSQAGVDGLIITMHGEFEEVDQASGKTGKRSFTRTFVLGPTAPGSATPIRVVSELLSLRAHNALPDQQPAPSAEEQQKQQLIEALSKQTNMTPQYSTMCLEQSGWNFENAVVKFNETRPNLGPEAFMTAA